MSPVILITSLIIILFVMGGLIFFLFRGNSEDRAAQARLEEVVGGIQSQVDDSIVPEDERDERRKLTDNIDEAIGDRGFAKNIRISLSQANLQLTVTEYIIVNIISIVATAGLAYFFYSGSFLTPIFVLAGAVLGFFLPRFYLGFRKGRRLKQFNDQLGDSITLMANGLRAGYSVLQAMDSVSEEMPDPIAVEFDRVVREIGLGVTIDRALNNMLERVPSDDLELMITAITIQSEVGGNLSEILEIIGEVIRERVRIAGEIKTLTAQGMLSGYVISLLPIILGMVLFAMNPEYLGRMFLACDPDATAKCTQPCGWIMTGGGLILIAMGFFAIQKIVKIEV